MGNIQKSPVKVEWIELVGGIDKAAVAAERGANFISCGMGACIVQQP